LKYIGERSASQLTPKKKRLYKEVLESRRQLRYAQRKNSTFKERLEAAEKYKQGKHIEQCLSILNPIALRFVKSQLKQSLKNKKGRRYSRKDKALAIALYKEGPKCYYRLLAKLFALPSPVTIKKELNLICLKPGFNENIFENLKLKIKSMQEKEKYVILMFDEMSIAPHVTFNSRLGFIEGFEDTGSIRRKKFSDHSLVFMIKGLAASFKQPVYFGYFESGAKYLDLKDIVRDAIKKLILE
jgi:hypothetical protein